MVTQYQDPKCLVVGNYCHDVLIKDDAVLAESLGGAVSFISAVLDGLSIPSHCVAKVGSDFAYLVNHQPLSVPSSKSTLFHAIFSSEIKRQDRVLKRVNACHPISPSDLSFNSKYNFGMAVGVAGEILPETLETMMDLCSLVLVDIQALIRVFDAVDGTVRLIELKETEFFRLLPKIGVLKASAQEAPYVDVEEARKWCCVVVTNGEDGCTVYWKDGELQIAPFRTVQVDPTGAGDSFLGGFVAGLVHGLAVPDAALLGNFFGSLTVGQIGLPIFDSRLLQALNVLLELSSSLADKSDIGNSDANIREDACSNLEGNSSQLTDRTSDSTPYSPESKFPENVGYMELIGRSHFQVLRGIDSQSSKSPGHMEPELSQQVLESLFNMPTPKSAEQEPNTMNWRNIVKKMTSLGQGIHPGDVAPMQYSPAKGDDYQVFRQSAKQHWESMKLCYQKAATAFSNGERDYAAILSEQGRTHNKMAREAEENASQDIFKARNKGIENMITIDLHGQHVKPAMRLLKLHLLFGAYVRSVRSFRVITGCGRHGVGKSKLKQSVINILEREGIEWSEENSGTLLIRLDQQTDFTFLDSDSEGE